MIYGIVIFIGVLAIVWLWFKHFAGPKIPSNIDALIKEISASEVPEMMPGTSGFVQNGAVKIGYEVLNNGQTPQATILLVNGHSDTLLGWPTYFYQPMLEAGYQVIRYDNRGVGSSDWLRDWTRETAYNLEHMASDGIAILDALNIQKAHIIGVSMGGMITQQMAIDHPNRVLSLTSIMSTGFYFDPALTNVPLKFYIGFIRAILLYGRNLSKEENKVKLHLSIRQLLEGKGDYKTDAKWVVQKALYEIRHRKGFNMKVRDQHSYAIKKSGSRYEKLMNIEVPTLVIHGKDDTLILFEHGKKYASMIPDAKTLFIEGMGHDLPEKYVSEVLEAILKNFRRGEKQNRIL